MPSGRRYKGKCGDGEVHVRITNITTFPGVLGQEYRCSVFGYVETYYVVRGLRNLCDFAFVYFCVRTIAESFFFFFLFPADAS